MCYPQLITPSDHYHYHYLPVLALHSYLSVYFYACVHKLVASLFLTSSLEPQSIRSLAHRHSPLTTHH